MSELKRCPICNGEVKLMFMNEESNDYCVWDADVGNVSTWFKCFGCDSEFFHDEPIDTPEKQIEWWNTRKPMQNIVERLTGEMNHALDICNVGLARGFDKAIEIVKEGEMNERI